MKIAILGGSFNPPHFGHLLVAEQLLGFMGVNNVWLMPCFKHPFGKKILPAKHRLAMAMFLANHQIKVSDFEIKLNKTSYTIDTLESLSTTFPKDEFFWVIGSEQLDDLDKWKNWHELIKKYRLIVFPREISTKKIKNKLLEDNRNLIPFYSDDVVVSNVSSTLIRDKIKKSQSLKHLVPEKVEKYIKKNHLYQ
jgi:nicotinate-nucleotide adenylyltransferase